MMTEPVATYRTVRNLEGFQAGVNEEMSGDGAPSGLREIGMVSGFLDENEYGEEVFVYPGVGYLGGIAANLMNRGEPSGDVLAATATTRSVDVFGGGLFGAMGGPAVSLMLSATPLRATEARSDMIGDIVRFLQPYGVTQEETLLRKVESAFVPAKWVGAVLASEKMVNDMSKAITIARLSSGEYGDASTWDEATSAKIRADVNRDARLLITLESLAKITLPTLGGFDFNPLIEMPDGKKIDGIPEGNEGLQYLLPHMLKAEYDKYMEGAEGDQRALREATFLRDWGEFAKFLNYGTTESSSGITYSNPEASKFAREEGGLYKEYRESIGLMLPGGDWDAEYDTFEKALTARDKALGVRRERSTSEQWEFLRQKALQHQKGVERAEMVRNGASESAIREMNQRYADLGLKYEDSGYIDRHLSNLRGMLQDEEVLRAVPSAQYVKRYIEMRDKAWDSLNQKGMASFSSDEAMNTPEVAWLYSTGMKAAADDPGFRTFWEQVAAQEFEKEG